MYSFDSNIKDLFVWMVIIIECVIGLWMDCHWALWTWWRHQIETFSALLALCEGNPPVSGLQSRETLMYSLICAWTNGWAKTRDAGDLRRHRAHYNVTVIESNIVLCTKCGEQSQANSQAICTTNWSVPFHHGGDLKCHKTVKFCEPLLPCVFFLLPGCYTRHRAEYQFGVDAALWLPLGGIAGEPHRGSPLWGPYHTVH